MPKYRVQVANRDTGVESWIVVEARDEQHAAAIADGQGWLVGKVSSADGPSSEQSGSSDRTDGNDSPSALIAAVAAMSNDLRAAHADLVERQTAHVRACSITSIVLICLATLCYAIPVYRFFEAEQSAYISSDRPGDRFQSDNAMGATANALESMAASWPSALSAMHGTVFLVAGLIVRCLANR